MIPIRRDQHHHRPSRHARQFTVILIAIRHERVNPSGREPAILKRLATLERGLRTT